MNHPSYVDYDKLRQRLAKSHEEISLGEIAKATGIDQSILSKFLRGASDKTGRDHLTLKAFAALVVWFECSADEFIKRWAEVDA